MENQTILTLETHYHYTIYQSINQSNWNYQKCQNNKQSIKNRIEYDRRQKIIFIFFLVDKITQLTNNFIIIIIHNVSFSGHFDKQTKTKWKKIGDNLIIGKFKVKQQTQINDHKICRLFALCLIEWKRKNLKNQIK